MARSRKPIAPSRTSSFAASWLVPWRWRRTVLAGVAVALAVLASCSSDFSSPSKINALRVLAVTADKPYALPGEDVTFRMTVYDGLGDPADPASGPRDLQVIWLAGCYNPAADAYFFCFQQLGELFSGLASGAPPPEGLVQFDVVPGAASGAPDGIEFTTTLPEDIVSGRARTQSGPVYGIAYLFFAVCAGQIAPLDAGSVQPWESGQAIEFPLQCLDANGNPQGADSFVPGYTQIYSFEDLRPNANPPIDGMTFDEVLWEDDLALAPEVPVCLVGESSRKAKGCARAQIEDCTGYSLNALVPDVAELDPGGVGTEGQLLREIVWVSYYADRGDVAVELGLVSEAREGYQESHDVLWYPPAEPGIATIWAVARDNRGGSSVARRFVRVQ